MRMRLYREGPLRGTKAMRMRLYHEGALRCTKPSSGVLARRAINGREEARSLAAELFLRRVFWRKPFVSDKVSANGLLVQANGGKLLAWDAFCATMGHYVPQWDMGACALSAGLDVEAHWGNARWGICLLSLGWEVAVTLRLLHARALQGNCSVCFHAVTFHFVWASGGGGNGMMRVGRFTPMAPR